MSNNSAPVAPDLTQNKLYADPDTELGGLDLKRLCHISPVKQGGGTTWYVRLLDGSLLNCGKDNVGYKAAVANLQHFTAMGE
jgi:hypothetical protein